ncbi:M61 family metallopeptidase [Simplicispira psychrophila]|uniref:M61 family metallopeptidase n=1 Tax=Simplicispira psychrophila TaxID=80882 RepID=UPI00047F27D2|nr:M61 family metallopeptidase [Simplicispira psychrophila]
MPARHHPASAVHYRVEIADLHAHLFRVTLTVAAPQPLQALSLPVWIPGSYLVREFSKNLQSLRAQQGGMSVPVLQHDKQRWHVACDSTQPLEVQYEVYANDPSVRTASLDATRGFFNGTSLCLAVEGQIDQPCTLDIVAPENIANTADWHCATGLFSLNIDASGFGLYQAADYDELVDCPVEMGSFWSASFHAGGVAHRFVVSGAAPSFDGKRLLADARKICQTAIAFWHGKGRPPFKNYLFLLNAVHDGYGGLEHHNSTALICARSDLPRSNAPHTNDGYPTLLGLISHEYFHAWNVKRLRPSEFRHYDYTQENYTELLWFFEGFTSYYDDLLLRRAGLIDDAAYLKLLTKAAHQVLQAPGRHVQTVAQASFDAWVKFYRVDENTANATISYYTKGALVALCLDLTLRRESNNNHTLDDVMRALWQRCQGGPMAESDVRAVLQEVSGRSFDAEIDAWVHSTAELPLAELLAAHGVTLQAEAPQPAQRLGLRVTENHAVQIKAVLRGGLAERAGMAAGDEWLGIEVEGQGWRLQKLEQLALLAGNTTPVTALVARDGRLLRLPLQLPNPATSATSRPRKSRTSAAAPVSDTVSLCITDAAAVQRWLAAP